MTVAVSRAKGRGAEAVICASTGNTAASAAAYAARAGMRGAVIVPEGKIAIGKLAQALMHGARVVALQGNFDDALRIVRELADKHPIELVNSVNPYRIEGQKTAAFEVVEELGGAPGALAIPVGNAGNVTAYWRGFQEAGTSPLLYGFQAEGAAPLVIGAPVAEPETVASAIRIGNPARWEEAMDAFTASRGRVSAVSDEQILDAYRWLAASEGVFCEPASAASVAGLLAHGMPVAEGSTPPESVVCVLTGHGLKDPDTALSKAPAVVNCENDLSAVERAVFESDDQPAPPRPRPRLLGEPGAGLRRAGGGGRPPPRARGRGGRRVLLRPRRRRGADRPREPDRPRLREPAPGRRDRLPAAQRDPPVAGPRLQRRGDRRRALRRRPPLRARPRQGGDAGPGQRAGGPPRQRRRLDLRRLRDLRDRLERASPARCASTPRTASRESS